MAPINTAKTVPAYHLKAKKERMKLELAVPGKYVTLHRIGFSGGLFVKKCAY
jgi:hypothetical protein